VPRDYSQRTPKKMKAAALRGALSDRARDGRVHVVEAFVEGETPSTKAAKSACARSPSRAKVLVVLERDDELNWLSLRNEPTVHLLEAGPAQHVRRAGRRRRGLHQGRARRLRGRSGKAADDEARRPEGEPEEPEATD
jgi:ribosomal protein L4